MEDTLDKPPTKAIQSTENEKPRNGIKGLVHWKQDLTAGAIVALVSMPLSLAVAVASGAPPVTGFITAIVAGLVLPLIGGTYVIISSPAAGMAPVLYEAIYSLGNGNMLLGYQLVLPLIVLAGIFQLGLSRLNVSALTKLFPPAVISGMLAAIGIIILIKQIPVLLGTTFEAYSVTGIIFELPSQLSKANLLVTSLGLLTLLLIAIFHFLSKRFVGLKILPPFSYALFISSLVSLSLPLASEYLLQLPSDPLQSIVFPDLHPIMAFGEHWGKLLKAFISILLINCIDSMAILQAVDNIDPYERTSDQKRSLLGIGACNIASGMLGGITVIPEAIRSTVGILAGSRTQWANFWNAVILLIGWLLLQPILTHIPLTVLAAVLIACSLNLCKPATWVMFWKEGKRSFAVFILTIILTVKIDMLWGLLGGCALSYVLRFIELKFAEKQ